MTRLAMTLHDRLLLMHLYSYPSLWLFLLFTGKNQAQKFKQEQDMKDAMSTSLGGDGLTALSALGFLGLPSCDACPALVG